MITTNRFKIITTMLVTILCTGNASSAYIQTSAGCQSSGTDTSTSCDQSFQDNYSYNLNISSTTDASIFHATLTNTSSGSLADALIDALAFNMNPNLQLGGDTSKGDQFNIINITPNWSFNEITKGSIEFDYLGTSNQPKADRIAPGNSLAFDFKFYDLSLLPNDPFNLWLLSLDTSSGKGIGGGGDSGQVAVSFQQLGSINDPCAKDKNDITIPASKKGECSDLLTSNWVTVAGTPPVTAPNTGIPEPTSIFLISTGLLGLFGASRKKS